MSEIKSGFGMSSEKQGVVKVLDWPENSPDLNPIGNLWSYMKNKIAQKQTSSGKEVVTAIKEVCVKEISTEYCESEVNSMPSYLAAVV